MNLSYPFFNSIFNYNSLNINICFIFKFYFKIINILIILYKIKFELFILFINFS